MEYLESLKLKFDRLSLELESSKFPLKIENLSQLKDINSLISSKNNLINGAVQSGKTKVILELSTALYKLGYDVIILVNNFNMDLRQIESRFLYYISENNLSKDMIKLIENKDAFSAKNSSNYIHISICNGSKVALFNKYFKSQKFITIIDESDIFNQDSDKFEQNALNRVSTELLFLFERSMSIIRITATSFSHIFVNEVYPLKAGNVYFLEHSGNYISYGHEKFKILQIPEVELDSDEEYSDDESVQESAADSTHDLDQFTLYMGTKKTKWTSLEKASFLEILRTDREYYEGCGILPIFLVNVSHLISVHKYIKNIIEDNFDDATTILVHEGIIKVTRYDGKEYETDTIQKALSIIQYENRKAEKNGDDGNKMIVIITCKQLGRGISTRSEVLYFNNISDIIYATSIIYCCSGIKSADELIQGSLRIGGQFPGFNEVSGFELRLHTTKNIITSLQEQFEWNQKIKENIIEHSKTAPETIVTELVVPLDKKPERAPISASRGHFHCKKVGTVYECSKDRIAISIKNSIIKSTPMPTILIKNDDKKKTTNQTTEFDEVPLINTIIYIIKKNNKEHQKLTCKKIYELGESIGAWSSLKSKTPLNTIATSLTRESDGPMKRIDRELNDQGIFEYWTI